MIKVKIELPNLEQIESKVQAVSQKALNEVTELITKSIADEAPSGPTGKLKRSPKFRRAKKINNIWTTEISVRWYGYDLNKGIEPSENIIHSAGNKLMTFPEGRWKNGNRGFYRYGYFWNGKYYFRRVHYSLKKNDFVVRGYRKVSSQQIHNNFFKNISAVFK